MPFFFILLGQYVWRSEIYIRRYGIGSGHMARARENSLIP